MIILVEDHAVERFCKRIDPTQTPASARALLQTAVEFALPQGKAHGTKGGTIYQAALPTGGSFRFILIKELPHNRPASVKEPRWIMTTTLPSPNIGIYEARKMVTDEARALMEDLREDHAHLVQQQDRIAAAFDYVKKSKGALQSSLHSSIHEHAKCFASSPAPPEEIARVKSLKLGLHNLEDELQYLRLVYDSLAQERRYIELLLENDAAAQRLGTLVRDAVTSRTPMAQALTFLYKVLEAAECDMPVIDGELRRLLGQWDFAQLQHLASTDVDPLDLSAVQLRMLQINSELLGAVDAA